MADVLSIVANIIQLVVFSKDVFDRAQDYSDSTKGLPAAFNRTSDRLAALLDALKRIKVAMDTGAMEESSREALRPTMRGCQSQIRQLNEIMRKALPQPGASKAKRTWKALESYRYDNKVERINAEIDRYMHTLTLHTVSSRYVNLEGMITPLAVPLIGDT